ncbi:hypothetical protein ACIBIZ_46880 [Nonomuraea spiralis]|uniref:hypothetical protein n=1 Tax=Nonomuraea TaxID=83681 RepID=UPI000F766FF4|nr:hypothetical protein [Nonomuraea sp. WAC 01424]RSM96167.1 hypothetical protein DMB42_48405 [Nonomuraea sp. WAC 01424]
MTTALDQKSRRPQPSGPPPVVHAAALLWLSAVAAGVFETVLAVGRELSEGASVIDLLPGAGLRVAVFTAAVLLALRMRGGSNWARLTLAVTLGVFGTLSLVVGPVQWLLHGGSIAEAAAGADAVAWLFTISRALHLTAVLGAVTLMFQPRANAWFRSA